MDIGTAIVLAAIIIVFSPVLVPLVRAALVIGVSAIALVLSFIIAALTFPFYYMDKYIG